VIIIRERNAGEKARGEGRGSVRYAREACARAICARRAGVYDSRLTPNAILAGAATKDWWSDARQVHGANKAITWLWHPYESALPWVEVGQRARKRAVAIKAR
jgi:hypothetical protein